MHAETAFESAAKSAGRTPLYPLPPPDFHRLQVALLVPAQIPLWLAEFIHLAKGDPWLDLHVICDPAGCRESSLLIPRLTRMLLRAEARLRRTGRFKHALIPVGMDALHDIHVRSSHDHVEADLVLGFGTCSGADALMSHARLGGWMFGASLADPEFAGTGLLPAMLDAQCAVKLTLELDTGAGPRQLLISAIGSGSADGFALLRERAFRKLPALLLRVLRNKAREAQVPDDKTGVARLELRALPSSPGDGRRILARVASRQWRRLRGRGLHPGEPWLIALRNAPSPLQPNALELGGLTVLPAPDGVRWADPCVFEHANGRYIFVEEFADLPGGAMGKGIIVALQLHPDGSVQRLGTVFDHPWHLSYPQLFHWQGDVYMTVEASAAGKVPLYRLREFPFDWEHVTDLISGQKCVDATLLQHGDRWYLFASAAEGSGSAGEDLFLFEAASPLGPFEPHPENPILCDATAARPAGPIFERDGKLYRPAQNGGPGYGTGIAFQEIIQLDRNTYRECTAGRLQPSGGTIDGCHTYCSDGVVEVLDIRDRAR